MVQTHFFMPTCRRQSEKYVRLCTLIGSVSSKFVFYSDLAEAGRGGDAASLRPPGNYH